MCKQKNFRMHQNKIDMLKEIQQWLNEENEGLNKWTETDALHYAIIVTHRKMQKEREGKDA